MNVFPDIQNIIFDLGGVIYNVDADLTYKAFQELGITDPEALYKQAQESKLFLDLEKGLITPKDFRENIKLHLNDKKTDELIQNAWNKMLIGIPKKRIKLLKKLKNKYNLYLLSNTNEIHYDCFTALYPGIFNVEFSTIFLKTYYSHHIHMRKPDTEIYEFVINDALLNPENTLFIDDLEANINTAKKLGIKTLHIKPGMELAEMF